MDESSPFLVHQRLYCVPFSGQEEDKRDYDMHRLAREDRLKGKKLRGKRKRKEEAREKVRGPVPESAVVARALDVCLMVMVFDSHD